MPTWASRLSTSGSGGRRTGASPLPSSSPAVASPPNSGPKAAVVAVTAHNALAPDLREEFRRVAEKYNEENVCMLRLPSDCWDLLTQYLSYMDVVALGQTCRLLWLVLHQRESVWWRQLAYFHRDVRDLRGGKLLCTAPLFPRPPPDMRTCQSESLVPSPTTAPSSSTAVGSDGRNSITTRPRRSDWKPMSAYERFFQERRVYVLDTHREWHFQELADVEDKATGMFTVALHDGMAESFSSPLSAEVAPLPFASLATPPLVLLPRTTASAVTTPILTANDGAANIASLNMLPSPISPTPSQAGHEASLDPAATPTPHRRTTSSQTPATSGGNSPALAPSPVPRTPPLLPRVGDPIINEHNPLLHLRVYTIDVHGAERQLYGAEDDGEEIEAREDNSDNRNACGSGLNGSHGASTAVTEPPTNLADMSEDEVLSYVMQLSLQETQAAARNSTAPARATPPAAALSSSHGLPQGGNNKAATKDPTCWPHSHYRGAPGSASLPLSELLTVVDSINNNALDQLHHHKIRECTADEDPSFLRRLAETLRSAKHRRLHLGNHHRAVRNNGQTTRNRTGRSAYAAAGGGSGGSTAAAAFSASIASVPGGVASTPPPPQPQPPPPMNRMLRRFHGDLLEITEVEARMVAKKLLGKPNIIDEFVVFHCYDPGELYHRLCRPFTSCARSTPAPAPTATTNTKGVSQANANAARQVMKRGVLVSVPAPLYADPAAGDGTNGSGTSAATLTYPSVSLPAVRYTPPLKALPFFTRFFLAPELCHDGYIALIVVDVVRVLVVVDKEVVTSDDPDWTSPLIDRGGRVVVRGQGYNPQAYTRNDYNYVPPSLPHRYRDSN